MIKFAFSISALGYFVGSLCEENCGTIVNCYYDSDNCTKAAIGNNYGAESTNVEGKTELKLNDGVDGKKSCKSTL